MAATPSRAKCSVQINRKSPRAPNKKDYGLSFEERGLRFGGIFHLSGVIPAERSPSDSLVAFSAGSVARIRP